MKSYKGYTRAQLIDILADYAVFTAKVMTVALCRMAPPTSV